MGKWNIYHKDGSLLSDESGNNVEVHSLEYSDMWMGECYLAVSINSARPIDFTIGDYILYRGDKYEINYEPGKIKAARAGSYGEAFRYEDVKFNSLSDELARCEMLDVVMKKDNNLHYTALPKFSFYVQSIDDLLDRIQANLNEQVGDGEWKIFSRNLERSTDRGCTEKEWMSVYGDKTISDSKIDSTSITIENQTCWDALSIVNSQFDINFIVRGRNVCVGTVGIPTANMFEYGKGHGLYEIEQTADSDQNVVTRLRAYGSDKNLPTRYYTELNTKYFAKTTRTTVEENRLYIELDVTFEKSYFSTNRIVGTASKEDEWVVTVTFDFTTSLVGYIKQIGETGRTLFKSEFTSGTEYDNAKPTKTVLDAFKKTIGESGSKLYFTSGVRVAKYPAELTEFDNELPNNMAVNRLMLPGFPQVSLQEFWDSMTDDEKKYVNPTGKEHRFSTDRHRPYIDSLNADKIGIRQSSVYFDNDDKTNGIIEIYPSIEEMEINGQRVDLIYSGSDVTDNGVFKDGESVPKFSVLLRPEIDFNINDLKDDNFALNMKTGMCGGRTFQVSGSVKENGCWKLTLDRVKDESLDLYFPYRDFQINKDDEFVLTGINLPDSYIRWNAIKMLKYAIAYLDANDYTRYVYQPKVDEIFMARQHDEAMKDTTGTKKSLHDTLKAGDLMQFEDSDLRIGGKITIDQLTIHEEDGKIPTYDVTLREDKEVGTIEKIQNQISSLLSGNGSGDITPEQIKNIISAEGAKHFLSRINKDSASGLITFLRGIALGDLLTSGGVAKYKFDADGIGQLFQLFLDGDSNGVQTSNVVSGNFSQAEKTGYWVTDEDGTGHSYMELDKLYVRYKAVFDELEIRKRTYVGGNVMFSDAASRITAVEWLDKDGNVTGSIGDITAFKCHLKTDDGTTQTQNLWRVDDLALCQTFNLKARHGEKVENKVYWRKVTAVGDDYICLSNVAGEYEGFGVDHTNDAALYGDGTKVLLAGGDAVVTEEDVLTADDGTKVPADFPEAEDSIVQCGNTSDTERQNMIELLTYTPATDSVLYGGCVAPALIQYKGISGFTLNGKARTVISPSGNVFRAKSFIVELDGESRRLPVDFGEWTKGKKYPYYARVSHGGCLWLLDKTAEDATSAEEPKDGSDAWTMQVSKGADGRDGDGLNVKGTVVEHFGSFTAYRNSIKEDHSKEEDPYFVLESGRVVRVNSAVLLDSGADYSEDHDGDVQQGTAKPSILTYTNDAIYDYDIVEASVPDAYMDSDGVLWVAGKDKWTNAGTIKGEKGDPGTDGKDAEWMEVDCYVLGGGIISSVPTDKDGKPKLGSFAVRLVRHVGSTGTVVPAAWSVPSQKEYGVELGSGGGFATVQYGTLTVDEMTFTARYKGKDYSKAIPVVRDGQTGDTGADGEDAIDVVMMPETLVFDTDDEGTFASAASQTSTIQVRKGDKPLAVGTGFKVNDYSGVNIAKDGYKLEQTDENTYTLTVDPKRILHYEKDGLTLPYTDGYVGVTLMVGNTVLVKRVMFRVNYAKYMGTFALTQKSLETTFASYKDETKTTLDTMQGQIVKNQSAIAANAESIKLKVSKDDMNGTMKEAGIDITSGEVVLQGEKVKVMNGTDTASVFENGKLNAELIEVTHLYAKDSKKNVIGYWGDPNDDNNIVEEDDGTTVHYAPLYVGGKTAGSSPFRVYSDGITYASKVQLVGGKIAGFDFNYFSIGTQDGNKEYGTMYLTNDHFSLNNGWAKGAEKSSEQNAYYRQSVLLNSSNPYQNGLLTVRDTLSSDTIGLTGKGIVVQMEKYGSTSNSGIITSATGADGNDSDINSGNHALSITHGDILGFRLRHRRFLSDAQLDNTESLVTIYKGGITLSMPTEPEDGMMIHVRNHTVQKSYLKVTKANIEWIEQTGSGAATGYKLRTETDSITIMPGCMMILTYDEVNTKWMAQQFMN